MSARNVATIAAKDLRILVAKRSVSLSIIMFPLIAAIGLPLVIRYAGSRHGGIPATVLPRLLNSFVFFFVIGAAVLPTAIASYSLVGEKVERSLEPLLATPVTDGEILLGKAIAASVPPIVVIWAGSLVFMTLTDQFTRPKLGHLYFPNGTATFILAVIAPLAAADVGLFFASRATFRREEILTRWT